MVIKKTKIHILLLANQKHTQNEKKKDQIVLHVKSNDKHKPQQHVFYVKKCRMVTRV